MQDFNDKVVAITGAGAGIGRALAENFAMRGARLALSDIDAEAAKQTAVYCEARGAEAQAYQLDVSDRSAFVAHAEEVTAHFGGINVAINNAGVALIGELTEVTWDQLDWVKGINVDGVLNGSKIFLPHLIASGDGHLVNMSSLWGLIGAPLDSHYCASKFFVRGLTESLRQEMRRAGHRVGVTAVHPGFVKTDLVRSGQHADSRAHQLSVNYVERKVRVTAKTVAEKVIHGVATDRARVLIGADAHAADILARALGPWYQHVMQRLADRLG